MLARSKENKAASIFPCGPGIDGSTSMNDSTGDGAVELPKTEEYPRSALDRSCEMEGAVLSGGRFRIQSSRTPKSVDEGSLSGVVGGVVGCVDV